MYRVHCSKLSRSVGKVTTECQLPINQGKRGEGCRIYFFFPGAPIGPKPVYYPHEKAQTGLYYPLLSLHNTVILMKCLEEPQINILVALVNCLKYKERMYIHCYEIGTAKPGQVPRIVVFQVSCMLEMLV